MKNALYVRAYVVNMSNLRDLNAILSLVEYQVEIALWAPSHRSPKSNSETEVARPNIVQLPSLIEETFVLSYSCLVDEENVNNWMFVDKQTLDV